MLDTTDAAGGADGSTWIYTYDQGGNMLSKCLYAYTTGTPGTLLVCYEYSYNDANWKDKLTAMNNVPISYDAIGNPVSDGTWNYVWDKGRQLKQISRLGEVVQFTYNEDGLRVQRVSVTNGVTKYTLHGKNIVHMTSGGHDLHFFYDAQNRPAIVSLDGVSYVYMYNLQGDVIALLDSTGNLVVYYTYDAWGRITGRHGALANNLGLLKPFRYRGYVYDEETGLYYVSSRYYEPKIGRWINADGQISGVGGDIRGYNLFAYCFNNPVNMIDPTGNWPSWGQVFAAVATVAVAAVFVAAVVASAGAVGVAAGVAAASIGTTGTVVSATITVGTVGTYAVAAGIGTCALSNAGEILTGTNVIRDELMGGNQGAYDAVQTVINIAGCGAIIIGQTNPGVTGNAAKPKPNAQTVHKVPTTGVPNTSFDKLYGGKTDGFQRTYYDFKGNVSLQIDFTNHNSSSIHSNPHLHIWGSSGRGGPINLRYLE